MAESERVGRGVERAAILLMAVGEKAAAEIMKHLTPKEVQKLGLAMASINNVTTSQVETVVGEFVETVSNQTSLGVGNEDYIRNVLMSALGEEKAGNLMDRIVTGATSKGLAALKGIDEILERQFSGNNNVKSSSVGGSKAAANILNFMDASKGAHVMDTIKEVDPDLAQSIEDLMFVFDNLKEVDDRGIQALLREVSSDSLILALKGSDDILKEKIFKNMSKRAAEMLKEDLEAKGPVRLSEVEAAQKEILAIARRMAEAGEINLGGQGGEEYV